MTSALVAGLVAGYGVALPVGAIATYLVGLGAREPLRTSCAAALGVATTDGLFALLAAVGGVGLAGLVRSVASPLTYVAAAVLIALAVRTVLGAMRRRRASPSAGGTAGPGARPLRAYTRLIALTALNPGTLVYFLALVLGGQTAERGPTFVAAAMFVAGVFVSSASWQLLLALSGAALGGLITSSRGQLAVAAVSSAIMIGLAMNLVVS